VSELRFIQIAVTQIKNVVVLYGLDRQGQVYEKYGADPWRRVPGRVA